MLKPSKKGYIRNKNTMSMTLPLNPSCIKAYHVFILSKEAIPLIISAKNSKRNPLTKILNT